MTLPAAIWPYLWSLCAVLGLVSWITSQTAAARSLGVMFAAYVSIRVMAWVFGDASILSAFSAFAWVAAASFVFRSGYTTASGIMVLSALCYFWANATDAPRVVGSLPFVVSDVLMVIAMVWIGWYGVSNFSGRTLDVVGGFYRGLRDTGAVPDQAARQSQEVDPQ